jgi:hypothetical protein
MSRPHKTDDEIPMKRKLLWTIGILIPTLLIGFVIGLTLDFNNGEHQIAITNRIIQSRPKTLEPTNISSDNASKQVKQWKVYLNGIGPIRLGMSRRDASQAIGVQLDGQNSGANGIFNEVLK